MAMKRLLCSLFFCGLIYVYPPVCLFAEARQVHLTCNLLVLRERRRKVTVVSSEETMLLHDSAVYFVGDIAKKYSNITGEL